MVKLEDAIKSNKFRSSQQKAMLNIMYTAYWAKNKLSNAFKEAGITAEQYNVLRILKGKHPEAMCVKDIASRMIEKNSNVPRIVDRLLMKKLVKRTTSEIDKRETLVSLTDKALLVIETCNDKLVMIEKQSLGLTEEEAGQLNELLEKLRMTE